MPTLIVVDRKGQEKAVNGESGLSVMEVIRDNGFDELLALCGGCCSCATCHVHVDPAYKEKMPAMGLDEDDLLITEAGERTLAIAGVINVRLRRGVGGQDQQPRLGLHQQPQLRQRRIPAAREAHALTARADEDGEMVHGMASCGSSPI